MDITILNLSRQTTAAQIVQLFKNYGSVESCNIVMDKVSGGSKGFGFIKMLNEREAIDAITNLHGTKFDGNIIRVKAANKEV